MDPLVDGARYCARDPLTDGVRLPGTNSLDENIAAALELVDA